MIRFFILISLLIHVSSKPASTKKWLTLNGRPPTIMARGGLSGVFPESSFLAIQMAMDFGTKGTVLYCNLQLTKDGVGLCQEDMNLQVSTNIDMKFPNDEKTYKINGKDVKGWFAVDYTIDDMLKANVTGMQTVLNRPDFLDDMFPLLTVEEIFQNDFSSFWLNVQNAAFYSQQKLNLASYIQGEKSFRKVKYISCAEIDFLKTMNGKVNKVRTQLIFVFRGKDEIEPSTNQTYGSILENLASVKAFASGIVVPKDYIWPVNKAKYLEDPTTLVPDAHELGLQVYATGFANDFLNVFNYSYDPIAEYLNFIDAPQFSVDGVITDFANTAASAIDKPLIISHNGASGIYSNCTDLAYEEALTDGADIIDCKVQMTKDGMAFCMGSADLAGETTAVATFQTRVATIPEIQVRPGIFSFDLTWSEVQTLKPQLGSPFGMQQKYPRNPAYKNAGKLVTLGQFLELAKTKAAYGILINIEVSISSFHFTWKIDVIHSNCYPAMLTNMYLQNAAYLAAKKGLDIIGAVNAALSKASLDKESTLQVLIQSDDTSVLSKFKTVPSYQRVFAITNDIGDAPMQSIDEIKKFADAVNILRQSVIVVNQGGTRTQGLIKSVTNVVEELKRANLTVYISVMRNEFFSLAFDYMADPTVEIATFAEFNMDGLVSEYPATVNRYFTNVCSDLDTTPYVIAIQPPYLIQLLGNIPGPASAPNPPLKPADVVDPALPPVAKITDADSTPAAPGSDKKSSSALLNADVLGSFLVASLVLGFLCKGY
uniref:glycerophosphodiester phosphodiesterase n=1 Tax=Manihot esculenta TaxID=3983 RepID=A0A2C9UMM8_MANES